MAYEPGSINSRVTSGNSSFSYDYGDLSETTQFSYVSNTTHVYPQAGPYVIKVFGKDELQNEKFSTRLVQVGYKMSTWVSS